MSAKTISKLGWDMPDTVAPLATASIAISGSSSIVEDDGSGNITTSSLTFSDSAVYNRAAFPWTAVGDAFEVESADEFYVMQWNTGSVEDVPLSFMGGVRNWTRLFTQMLSGSAGIGIAHTCIFQVLIEATRTSTTVYNPDNFPPGETPPDLVVETDYNILGYAELTRAFGGGTGKFTLNIESTPTLPGAPGDLSFDLTSGDIDFQTLSGILSRDGTHTWTFSTPPDPLFTTYSNSYTATLTLA